MKYKLKAEFIIEENYNNDNPSVTLLAVNNMAQWYFDNHNINSDGTISTILSRDVSFEMIEEENDTKNNM